LANHASAAKAARQGGRRHKRNRSTTSAVRTHLRAANTLVASGSLEGNEDVVRRAISAMDRAVTKGVAHANNAARHKSRLMKKLNAAKAAEE